MRNRILLVGNGSSLLDKEYSNIINTYSIIVRFNSFRLSGYERFVGNRTDVWFTVNRHHFDKINSFDKVVFHSWANQEKCKMFKELKQQRNDVEKVSENVLKKIPLSFPSSGLIAIYYFDCNVDLIGFDWWGTKKHHYGDLEVRGKLHNPKKEYEIIKSLNVNIIS